MPFEREKEQVQDGLTHNNVPIGARNRFTAFTRHPICDTFIQASLSSYPPNRLMGCVFQQAVDYIDTYFNLQLLLLKHEKMQRLRCLLYLPHSKLTLLTQMGRSRTPPTH